MIEAAIALGIAINLALSALVGVGAAGLVVPGYLALHFSQPDRVLATLAVALATWAAVRFGLARAVILYGRRRLGAAVLVGFVVNALLEVAWRPAALGGADLRVIGHIVPGLIAAEALAQGVWPTIAMTLVVSALTRIALLLLFGWSP
jgi:poly-gamma-glutamate biosynthesis protein PgsC/CapC